MNNNESKLQRALGGFGFNLQNACPYRLSYLALWQGRRYHLHVAGVESENPVHRRASTGPHPKGGAEETLKPRLCCHQMLCFSSQCSQALGMPHCSSQGKDLFIENKNKAIDYRDMMSKCTMRSSVGSWIRQKYQWKSQWNANEVCSLVSGTYQYPFLSFDKCPLVM